MSNRLRLFDLCVCAVAGVVVFVQFGDVLLFFAGGGAGRIDPVAALVQHFDGDSLLWIRGAVLGNPWRLSAHTILNDICLPLMGDRYAGYYLPSAFFHWCTACVVYALVVTTLTTFRSAVSDEPWLVRAAGVVAATVFLTSESNAQLWIATLGYVLVGFITPLMVLVLLWYLRSRRLVLWLGVIAIYAIGLVTHSLAFGLPVLCVAVESLFWLNRRSRPSVPLALGRYVVLAGVFVVFCLEFSQSEVPAFEREVLLEGSLLAAYPAYMDRVTALGLPLELIVHHLGRTGSNVLRWLFVGLLFGMALTGAWSLRRGRQLARLSQGVLVCWVVWSALSFGPIMVNGDLAGEWRYVSACVGFAICLGLFFAAGAHLLFSRLAGRRRGLGLPAVTIAVTAFLLLGDLDFTGGFRSICAWVPLVRAGASVSGDDCTWARSLRPAGRLERPVGACYLLTDLGETDLLGVDLEGAVFVGTDLRSADLRGAQLTDSVFISSFLVGSIADSSTTFEGAYIVYSDGTGVSWSGADLRNIHVYESDLSRSTLRGVDLRGADLASVDLLNCDLGGADLSGTVLTAVDFDGSDLEDASFVGASCDEAVLTNAELRGAVIDVGSREREAGGTEARID